MKGDFSRDSYLPYKHFTRVLMQQGRVQLDADWNEQASIMTRLLRHLAADLIGQHGGPQDHLGFEVIVDQNQVDLTNLPQDEQERVKGLFKDMGTTGFVIGTGHYYVDGILLENERYLAYTSQPDYRPGGNVQPKQLNGDYLAYLDVWERHVCSGEDDDIREIALGGPDTTSRAQLVWQVKLAPMGGGAAGGGDVATRRAELEAQLKELVAQRDKTEEDIKKAEAAGGDPALITKLKRSLATTNRRIAKVEKELQDLVGGLPGPQPGGPANLPLPHLDRPAGTLRARARQGDQPDEACIISPDASYRGAENQLYRVEIHDPSLDENGKDQQATFKWSRENGSVIFPLLDITPDSSTHTTLISLASLGRDERLGLAAGDWLEILDDQVSLNGVLNPLYKVLSVERGDLTVTVDGLVNAAAGGGDALLHPYARRWDSAGRQPVQAPGGNNGWIALEDGIEVRFEDGQAYQSGDYWLIPARTITGDVLWPKERDVYGKLKLDANGNPVPAAKTPDGVEHHYAPLWQIHAANGTISLPANGDQRKSFPALAQ